MSWSEEPETLRRRPETFEEYAREVHRRAVSSITAKDARAILAEHGEHVPAKLRADEVKEAARRYEADWARLVASREHYWRWDVVNALGVGYDRARAIERKLHVRPFYDNAKRGEYTSAADARAVWDAACSFRNEHVELSVIVRFGSIENEWAARAVARAMAEQFDSDDPSMWRSGYMESLELRFHLELERDDEGAVSHG